MGSICAIALVKYTLNKKKIPFTLRQTDDGERARVARTFLQNIDFKCTLSDGMLRRDIRPVYFPRRYTFKGWMESTRDKGN